MGAALPRALRPVHAAAISYGVAGTPMGFRVDAEGRVASELAVVALRSSSWATPFPRFGPRMQRPRWLTR